MVGVVDGERHESNDSPCNIGPGCLALVRKEKGWRGLGWANLWCIGCYANSSTMVKDMNQMTLLAILDLGVLHWYVRRNGGEDSNGLLGGETC